MKTVETKPFQGQEPGTSGLRKKVTVFQQEHYVENFIQSIFDSLEGFHGKTLVVGGDGRYFNKVAIQKIIKIAAANGFGKLLVAHNGILSTPAVSNKIRKTKSYGGIILTASHNPGGPDGDFGIKYNMENGGPAPEKVTQAIHEKSKVISKYIIAEAPDVDLSKIGTVKVLNTEVEIFDSVKDYSDMMESIFDFDLLRSLFAKGFRMRFDAMSAVSGPYATHIFEELLKAPKGTVVHEIPLEDFGGLHPDPNPVNAHHLVEFMASKDATEFAVACDGDSDRNMILGKNLAVSPSDSLAVLAANAKIVKNLQNLPGVARSMPSSAAVDRVAKKLGIDVYETPTGWKFFGNLLDSGKIKICGEESYGTGGDHVREKDAIWAILFWLTLIATSGKTVNQIMEHHWKEFGRNYYSRHDYEAVDSGKANEMMNHLRGQLVSLVGKEFEGKKIKLADDFKFVDSIDGSVSDHQGIRLIFEDDARIIFRLSGTGTVGATIRVYFDQYEAAKLDEDPQVQLGNLIRTAQAVAKLREYTGMEVPTVIT